jgi:YcxB-like protein
LAGEVASGDYSPMRATFRISEEDYVGAMMLFAKLTPRMASIYLASAVVLAVLAVFGSPVLRGGAIGGLIGGVAVTLIGRYIATPMLARRHYRKYKGIQDEFGVELVSDGVRFTSPSADGKTPWDKMYKWRQNEEFVLIYLMPRLFHIIPKSVASHEFNLQDLINRLLQHVGKPA